MTGTIKAMVKSEPDRIPHLNTVEIDPDWKIKSLAERKEISDIGSRIIHDQTKENIKCFHFASCNKGEGTSTILINLTLYMLGNQAFENVLIVDGNLNSPALHSAFNMRTSPGLTDVIDGSVKISETYQRIQSSNVWMVTCGDTMKTGAVKLAQKEFSRYLSEMKKDFGYILIDSSPLLSTTDSLIFALSADITYLVVQAQRTKWEVLSNENKRLEEYNCKVGGVILNKRVTSIPKFIYKRL